MQIDYRYTWTIPRSAWYIRFYCWLWDASGREITFCKLFWTYALVWAWIPLGFILRIAGGAYYLSKRIHMTSIERAVIKAGGVECYKCESGKPHRTHYFLYCTCLSHTVNDRYRHDLDCRLNKSLKKYALLFNDDLLADVEPKLVQWLNKVANGFSRLVMWSRSIPTKYFKWLGWAVIAAMGLAGLIGFGITAANHPVEVLLGVGGAIGIAAIFVVMVIIGLVIKDSIPKKQKKPPREPKFKQVMQTGYVAVKSNTCPRVMIEE